MTTSVWDRSMATLEYSVSTFGRITAAPLAVAVIASLSGSLLPIVDSTGPTKLAYGRSGAPYFLDCQILYSIFSS